MTIREKMHNTELYLPTDPEIMKEQQGYMNLLYDFNHTRPTESDKREALLKELFADLGEGCFIEPPLHANWGGHHVHFGKNVYANFNLTLVDDTHIYIGDHTMIGPNVVIATGGHPLLPELRQKGYQYNAPFILEKIAGSVRELLLSRELRLEIILSSGQEALLRKTFLRMFWQSVIHAKCCVKSATMTENIIIGTGKFIGNNMKRIEVGRTKWNS